MATDRLKLYNAALGLCEERKLATLSEDRSPRRKLDDVWDNGFVDEVLSEAMWIFATRTIELTADEDTETQFGFANAFVVQEDHLKTVALCEDESFNVPLTDYHVEAGFWYANVDPLWVRYVSNHADYGLDLSKWPPKFCRFAEQTLAIRIHPRLTGSSADLDKLKRDLKKITLEAKSADAWEKPTQFMPQGSWVGSRRGGRSAERGNRSRLIG